MKTKTNDVDLSLRQFIKNLGFITGGSALLASTPWLASCTPEKLQEIAKEKARVALIGTGSRGQYHLHNLKEIHHAEVVALCDNYEPNLKAALEIFPKAKGYSDYRKLLEQRDIDGVIIATPLNWHAPILLDALAAGKHVFCEKAMARTLDDCKAVYNAYQQTDRVLFFCMQRMYDKKYVKAMQFIHSGLIGDLVGMRCHWFRNNDWRRPVPSPELERKINWRLYKESSGGLMTELACHQLQTGTWALRQIPNKVMGHGAITYWKDGRTVYDNISCIYVFDNGVKMTYDSVISNKFYGLEEKILGSKGTVEPEKGKYYFEETEPAAAFIRLINDIEHDIFDAVPFAGTSWEPESANENKGEYILGKSPKEDGTSLMLDAFVEAVISQKQPERVTEEAYYSSALSLLGHQALEEERVVTFPDEYKLNYLNHVHNSIL